MPALQGLIPQLALNKIADSIATDTPIVINTMAVGTSAYAPNISQTTLVGEVIRNPIDSKVIVSGSPNTFNVTAKFTSTSPITAREFGVFADDGTLMAVWSVVGYIGVPISDPNFTVLTFTFQVDANCPVTIISSDVIVDVTQELDALGSNIMALTGQISYLFMDQNEQWQRIIHLENQVRYLLDTDQVHIP